MGLYEVGLSLAGELLCVEEQYCRKTRWSCLICIKANSFKDEENGGNFFFVENLEKYNLCSVQENARVSSSWWPFSDIPTCCCMIWQLKWDFFKMLKNHKGQTRVGHWGVMYYLYHFRGRAGQNYWGAMSAPWPPLTASLSCSCIFWYHNQ